MARNISVVMSVVNVSPSVYAHGGCLCYLYQVNCFAGTRLEDLQGEIPDQHGCRYLQRKLEEGVSGHRDMIFRETFGHFADLMTGESIFPLG